MKAWGRYLALGSVGIAIGLGAAVVQVKRGMPDGQIRNGPWTTAKTYGSVDADALTRARVALSGLLALPAGEAMYFNASTDSAGGALTGACSYSVTGTNPDARWWSITVYDRAGYLIPNAEKRYSMGSGSGLVSQSINGGQWRFLITAKEPPPGVKFIPLGKADKFDLTLRVYHPSAAMRSAPDKAVLPTIKKEACS